MDAMTSRLQSEAHRFYAELVRDGLLVGAEVFTDHLVVVVIPPLACVDLTEVNQGAKHG